MKLVTADDIAQSIGVQSDFITQEILRTGACRREWRHAVAIVSEQMTIIPPSLGSGRSTSDDETARSPRMRRLLDLLAVADPLMMAFRASRFEESRALVKRAA